MSIGNRIARECFTPLTDKNSGFYMDPDLPPRKKWVDLMKLRENPLFKRAKCIYVHKIYESKNIYRLCGTKRKTKHYGVAVLTDDNKFYFNEYTSKQMYIVWAVILDLFKLLIDPYIIDKDTRIMFSDNMMAKNEPIIMMLEIMARRFGVPIFHRSTEDMINAVNSLLKNPLGVAKRKKLGAPAAGEKRLTNYSRGKFERVLLEDGRLDFLPENLMNELLDPNTKKRRHDLIFWCAVGVLYLHNRIPFQEYARKKRKALDELSQTRPGSV